MLKAKDMMTKNVISVKKDIHIYEALEILADHNISGIPVVREDMITVGVLSEKDMIRLVHHPEELDDKTVDDFMTQPAVHFDEEESFDDICDCLEEHYFRRVPITSEGRLVGLISRSDVIKYILKLRRLPTAK